MSSINGMPPGGTGMMHIPQAGSFSSSYRIGPTALTASIFTFLGIAIFVASGRLFLRFRTFRRVGVDDAFLIAAVVIFAASCGITQSVKNLTYEQLDVNTERAPPPRTFAYDMLMYNKLNTAESILQWLAIYSVKFSYLLFFRPLIRRIRYLEIWWWCVLALLVPAGLVSTFMAIWMCPYYDLSFLQKCVLNGEIIVHERIFLNMTTSLDIATDILIISIPVALLCKVRLELSRKLALGVVLCLSVFMIVIASVRLALVNIPTTGGNSVPDTAWLFFWQAMEACIAIIMVSLTAFRSLYGQERARRTKGVGYDYVNESSVRNRIRRSILGPPKQPKAHSESSGDSPHYGRELRRASHWDQEEMRIMEKAYTRPSNLQETWLDEKPERQARRDRPGPPSPLPHSFV